MRACKDCTERYSACWATCERYLADKKAYEEQKAARVARIKEDRTIGAVQFYSRRQAKKDEIKRQKQGRKK